MKWWKVGVGIFLLIGIVIAFFSLYKASVDGLMTQLGLVGSDFSVSVVQEKLAEINEEAKSTLKCELPSRIRGSVIFLLSRDENQGRQAFYLGQERIKCGAAMLASGDVETGTYEVVKGIGYLNKGYQFVNERGELDGRVCESLPTQEIGTTVQQILEATSGKVFEIVWEEWQGIAKTKEQAEKICLDQRNSTR